MIIPKEKIKHVDCLTTMSMELDQEGKNEK